jgi:hypothetical protein
MSVTVGTEFRRQTKPLALLGNGRTTEYLVIVRLITLLIQLVCKGEVHPSTGHERPELE